MEDERDAGDAIRKLDRIEFGKKRRQLRVEWTKVHLGWSFYNKQIIHYILNNTFWQFYCIDVQRLNHSIL